MSDFVVIGGGVIGLMLARQLLQGGARVTVLEAGQCGREASWAGGGIVSPLYPWRYSPAVTALASQAQRLFPALCSELLAETGIDPEHQQTGLLMLDAPDAGDALAWAQQQGVPMVRQEADQLASREPQLAVGFASGLWMPQVANVRNPRLLQALLASLRQHPHCRLREFAPVLAVGDGHADLAAGERVTAGQVVVCSGAWSGELLAASGVALPVLPVLGQMLLYRLSPGWLTTMVLHEGRYAIPRRDGHVLVGSTLEQRGFDKTITDEARGALQAAAEAMLPGLRGVAPLRQWAGLRPGAPEGVPFMGRVPGHERLWVCAGHFRNGLVLSPASAQLLADMLLGRTPAIDPAPYRPVKCAPFPLPEA